MEDEKIVELYMARDERAISETSIKYGSKLMYIANKILSDNGKAEECTNDTYLKTWESIPPHEPKDYFFAYIARIVRMLALSVCRKNYASKRNANVISLTQEMEECIGGSDSTSQAIDEILLRETINKFLKSLNDEKRDMFVRRYFFMDDIKSIAKRHKCSESKVTTKLMRIRKKLKICLEAQGINV